MRKLGLLLAFLVSGCTSHFFYPDRVFVQGPERFGLEYREMQFAAADGTGLYSWFLPARGEARGTILFLHGNAQNISAHLPSVAWLPAQGFNVLALDYRGYGRSGGSADLPGIMLDIDAAMRVLLERPEVRRDGLIVFGQSLGAALAIHSVANSSHRQHVRAVVADSPFADYRQVVREKMAGFWLAWPFQWLPALTVNNDYSPRKSVAALSPIPLLLLRGERDGVVPPHHAQLLYDAAREPKELWSVPEAGHIGALGSAALRRRLVEFLGKPSGSATARPG
ncbi:MAG TPA: alpha/beta fold hydrolase [Burkholderiales bacterium]|nr:alpha/beta fold hydrolase [Burkholderiales bacterium]